MSNQKQPRAWSPEHCDDAQLMAFLSDDLASDEWARVEGHLALCWPCNKRHLELRGRMQQIRDALEQEGGLGRAEIEQARREFFTRFSALEAELEAERIPTLPSSSRSRNAAFARLAIAAAILCVLGATIWLAIRPSKVRFDDVIAQTLEHEDGLRRLQAPLHQEFEIEIEQVGPVPQRRTGRLQVWYDSNGERFAGRWERDDGELQYAVWRPEPDREFVFNAQRGPTAVPRIPQLGQSLTLGELSFEEAGLEQLETGFLYWLSNRRWEPISIASDLNVFRMREGVVAEVELLASETGGSTYRITARRETAWGSVEVVAEVDARTYQPRIELLRLVSAERIVELRLRAQRNQWLDSAAMETALFWPSVDIEGAKGPLAGLEPELSIHARETPPEPRSAGVASAADLDLAEMRVHYALHEAGACLGVPVRVDRTRPGLVRLEGLVESPERKHELLMRLAGISAAPFVSIEIKTVDEALRDASSSGSAGEFGASTPPHAAMQQADETLEVVATDSPIREALHRYLSRERNSSRTSGGSPEDGEVQQMASEFSNRIISNSLANLTEAWALRRLAERYGPSARELPEPAAALLRKMLAAHVSALLVRTADIRKQVRPLLLAVEPDSVSAASSDEPGPAASESSAKQDWATQSLSVFQQIESTEALTTGLFADSGYANGARRQASSEHAAAALLRALPRLESRLQSLEKRLAALEGTAPGTGIAVDAPPARDLP